MNERFQYGRRLPWSEAVRRHRIHELPVPDVSLRIVPLSPTFGILALAANAVLIFLLGLSAHLLHLSGFFAALLLLAGPALLAGFFFACHRPTTRDPDDPTVG